jgi:hypothetical protein
MAAVVAQGRHWVPSRAVAAGSFVELTDGEVQEVARKERCRWYERRLAAGWRAARPGEEDNDHARINSNMHPWADLPAERREGNSAYVRSQLEKLEAVGFMPVLPDCEPPGAVEFLRTGEVRAERLTDSLPWRSRSGDKLAGADGDWHVIGESGDERTVRDLEFRETHELLDGDRWRRTSTVRAWRVEERVVLRTLEGRAVARPGDWIVQGPRSVRWPIKNEQFERGYRRISPGTADPAAG